MLTATAAAALVTGRAGVAVDVLQHNLRGHRAVERTRKRKMEREREIWLEDYRERCADFRAPIA